MSTRIQDRIDNLAHMASWYTRSSLLLAVVGRRGGSRIHAAVARSAGRQLAKLKAIVAAQDTNVLRCSSRECLASFTRACKRQVSARTMGRAAGEAFTLRLIARLFDRLVARLALTDAPSQLTLLTKVWAAAHPAVLPDDGFSMRTNWGMQGREESEWLATVRV